MATTRLWTAEEIADLPDDGFRYALIRGELYRMPPTKPRHGRIVAMVARFIGNFVDEHDLGVVYDQSGFFFERDPDTVLGPDLAFVQAAHVPADENAYPEVPPDLVVEVISPSDSGPSLEEKVAIYLQAGVRLVWAIDSARRRAHVYRPDGTRRILGEDDALDGEDVLPGFTLPLARLFAPPGTSR
jgi:Uma2 family endonuclease